MNIAKKAHFLVIAVFLMLGLMNIGYLLGVSNLAFASVSSPVSGPVSGPIVTPTPTSIPAPVSPNIQITYPVNGSTVMPDSIVTLQASASSSAGVNRVVFQINGNSICSDSSSPYACDWKVPSVSPASYKITGWVIDNAGSKKSVTVNVTAGPNIYPVPTPTPTPSLSVNLTSPSDGAKVTAGSKMLLQAEASSSAGINRVVFHINGTYHCTDYTAPYSCGWSNIQASGDTHIVTAWAIDNVNRKANSSAQVTVEPSYKRVFVTSTSYSGNLGGLAGADQKCQDRANAANLGGSWKAWLSDSKVSAASRLNHSTVPYALLNGNIIAYDWNDLVDGFLLPKLGNPANGISVNEFGQVTYPAVRTGTQIDGSSSPSSNAYTCVDWLADYPGASALIGLAGTTDFQWTAANAYACSANLALYCFEQ